LLASYESHVNVSNFPPNNEPQSEAISPKARYGHAMGALEDGFVLYGGQLAERSLSDEFFYYDASRNEWTVLAGQSQVKPPPLTRHTLCVVNSSSIFVFGGSMANGEFSSKLFRIELNTSG
jgi:N-acetylneuraminic acid mutarotase